MQVKVRKVKEAYIYDLYSDYYELLICRRSGWDALTRDHTVLPTTHTFRHKKASIHILVYFISMERQCQNRPLLYQELECGQYPA